MKLTSALLAVILASAVSSCTYNTYVEPVKTTPKPTTTSRPAPTKSASVSGGGSAEGFQAVTKPSSYSQ